MRLRTIIAASMSDGMRRVRQQLGPEAVIVQTQEIEGGGVVLTAAVEAAPPAATTSCPVRDRLSTEWPADPIEALHELLNHHRLPPPLMGDLLAAAEEMAIEELPGGLARLIEARFAFAPVSRSAGGKPLLLVGPAGAGKTVTAAKLAAETVLAGGRVALVSADTERAGGTEQLDGFARALGLDLLRAPGLDDLRGAVHVAGRNALVLIDGPGVDPFAPGDMMLLRDLTEAARAEPLAILPAGADALEAAETAAAFAAAGATRFVASRTDAARRLGSLLAAMGSLSLAELGTSRRIAAGLRRADAAGLSAALLARMPPALRDHDANRAERAGG